MNWSLRFLGVGSAQAVELGSASAVLEREGQALLMIDCGPEALTAYLDHYGSPPPAIFLTHTHLDHIGGLERLFFRLWFDPEHRGRTALHVPAPLVPWLQTRIADYPGVLAEGGVNYWEAFRLVPHSRGFWLEGHWFDSFAVRHHQPETAFGLALRGSFVYSGDTRPIPEVLARYAANGEIVAHDCALIGNPSHSGVDDLEREYDVGLRARLLLYHYGSQEDGRHLAERGYAVARPGGVYPVRPPGDGVAP